MDLLKKAERPFLRPPWVPFRPGDNIAVDLWVKEGTKTRIQRFQGLVIARRGGGLRETFTVRKISNGVGVERIFPVHSPTISYIGVVKRGKARRAKLHYIRSLSGKRARLKERLVKKGFRMVESLRELGDGRHLYRIVQAESEVLRCFPEPGSLSCYWEVADCDLDAFVGSVQTAADSLYRNVSEDIPAHGYFSYSDGSHQERELSLPSLTEGVPQQPPARDLTFVRIYTPLLDFTFDPPEKSHEDRIVGAYVPEEDSEDSLEGLVRFHSLSIGKTDLSPLVLRDIKKLLKSAV